MKNITKKILSCFAILYSINLYSETNYYETIDAFTDEKVFYIYNKSQTDSWIDYPAYFKLGLTKNEGYWIIAFNSEFLEFAFGQSETAEVKVRFDKNPPFGVDAYFCSTYDEYLEDCRVSASERDPSFGLFTLDYDGFISEFNNQLMSSKTLMILFPGLEPIEFDLRGTATAVSKFNANLQ